MVKNGSNMKNVFRFFSSFMHSGLKGVENVWVTITLLAGFYFSFFPSNERVDGFYFSSYSLDR